MGAPRPRHLAVGLALVLGGVGWAGAASGQVSAPAPRSEVVHGGVSADGAAVAGSHGWRVTHPSRGRYRLRLPGGRVTLDVTRWDAVADATAVPLGNGAVDVRFDVDGRPVDTAFTFVAAPRRR